MRAYFNFRRELGKYSGIESGLNFDKFLDNIKIIQGHIKNIYEKVKSGKSEISESLKFYLEETDYLLEGYNKKMQTELRLLEFVQIVNKEFDELKEIIERGNQSASDIGSRCITLCNDLWGIELILKNLAEKKKDIQEKISGLQYSDQNFFRETEDIQFIDCVKDRINNCEIELYGQGIYKITEPEQYVIEIKEGFNVIKTLGPFDSSYIEDFGDLEECVDANCSDDFSGKDLTYSYKWAPGKELVETEILTRIKNENGQIQTPGKFLHIVNSVSYVSKLDWAVVERSFAFKNETQNNQIYSVNINLSTIKQDGFIKNIESLVEHYRINPKEMIFEILEYEILDEPQLMDKKLGKLREMGFRIAIDDFPSGNNTLYRITKFKNIDIVKIDGNNIRKMIGLCSNCNKIKQCVSSFEDSVDISRFSCIKAKLGEVSNNEQEGLDKYSLETLIRSILFIKKHYSHIEFFGEWIKDKSVYDFLKKCVPVVGFQGFGIAEPVQISSGDGWKEKSKLIDLNQITDLKPNYDLLFSGWASEVQKGTKNRLAKLFDDFMNSQVEFLKNQHKIFNLFTLKDFEGNQLDQDKIDILKSIMKLLSANCITFYTRMEVGQRDGAEEKVFIKHVHLNNTIRNGIVWFLGENSNIPNEIQNRIFIKSKNGEVMEKHLKGKKLQKVVERTELFKELDEERNFLGEYDEGYILFFRSERTLPEIANIYKLLKGIDVEDYNGYKSVIIPVPGEGEDAVIQVNDRFMFGIDDDESALDFQNDELITQYILLTAQSFNHLFSKV